MNGTDLLDELSKRIKKRLGVGTITDRVLADEIGVTARNLALLRDRELTPRQVVNLIDQAEKRGSESTIAQAISPIVEFFHIDHAESKQGAKWELFSDSGADGKHPYLTGLKKRLESTRGIYLFYDSRGRAIYAGKTRHQTLWKEMNLVFNKESGNVQNIFRVSHPTSPTSRKTYRDAEDGARLIRNQYVALHEIATYVSAYEIADELIGKLEALIVRAFANDLLNVRMEKFDSH